ncbi:hypothetical protein ACWGI8_30840 [Streptomyces sp. NPDC054841]
MLIISGAALALALAVVLIVVLNGGGEGGGGSASASPTDSTAAKAAAHDVTTQVALAPADWAPGFVQNDPYETDPTPEALVLPTCEYTTRPNRVGTLAALTRSVFQTSSAIIGTSEVRVYTDEATAKKYLADARDEIHRCPNQHQGKQRWDSVREAGPPKVAGFDEQVAEEGRQIVADDGTKVNNLYVIQTGREGDTVLSASVIGDVKQEAQVRKYATDALKKMQERLKTQSGAIATR